MKNTGQKWDEVAQPDIYSCFSDDELKLCMTEE